MTEGVLTIDGKEVPLSARYSLRWVNIPGGPAEAVLYQDGKRVVAAWSLTLRVERPADPYGGNANTQ
jgi:hypothetical protein